MLGMRANVPVRGRMPLVKWRPDFAALGTAFYPSTEALRLLLIWRVADDDGDLFLTLDLVRAPAGLAKRQENLRDVLFLYVRVAERIGHEEPHRGRRSWLVEQRL